MVISLCRLQGSCDIKIPSLLKLLRSRYAVSCHAIYHIFLHHFTLMGLKTICNNTRRGVFPSEGSELFTITFCPQNLELNSFRAVLVLKYIPQGILSKHFCTIFMADYWWSHVAKIAIVFLLRLYSVPFKTLLQQVIKSICLISYSSLSLPTFDFKYC